jgi:hypothetical protein
MEIMVDKNCYFFLFRFEYIYILKEAYSVARQFNLIPPICEQAEYHLFQREKVELLLPDVFQKIGWEKK